MTMSSDGYPVEWRGRKFTARDMTDKMKFAFCVWAFDHMLENARQRMSWNQFNAFQKLLVAAPPEWTSLADPDIIAILGRVPGKTKMMRLVLGVPTEDDMSAEDFDAMLLEKATPTSDLTLAMKRIKEDSDPKAQRGELGSPRPEAEGEPTPPSAESPSI